MFCFKCGSKQADTAKFCGVCGTKLAGVVSSPESVVPTPPRVVPAGPTPTAPRTPSVVGASPSASLTVEQWEVTGHPPDSDGDSRVEAKAVVVYDGGAPASLARLRWIAYDPTGQLPLFQGESDFTRDIDDGDDIELEASSYGKLGTDVTADACRVEAQVLVYPGERATILSIPLPEAGVVGARPEDARVGAAKLLAWKVSSSESSEESASYSVTLVVRNDAPSVLAAVTVRLRVTSRKGDVWTTDYVTAEHVGPGELRVLEASLWLSERARARMGASLQVTATACAQPVVRSLETTTPNLAAPQEDAEAEERPDSNAVDVALDAWLTCRMPVPADPADGFFYLRSLRFPTVVVVNASVIGGAEPGGLSDICADFYEDRVDFSWSRSDDGTYSVHITGNVIVASATPGDVARVARAIRESASLEALDVEFRETGDSPPVPMTVAFDSGSASIDEILDDFDG